MVKIETTGLTAKSLSCGDGRPFFRRLINIQVGWSRRFDHLLPPVYSVDGNRDFLDDLVPRHLRSGMRIYDVGGGKNPVISRHTKTALDLRVVGLDIDHHELLAAPTGAYDESICADITQYAGAGDADLVICQSTLEHTRDNSAALKALAGILKLGGRALVFAPSRNAVYARLNLLLPEQLKRRILWAIYPEMSRDHGFPAYYDRCTPAHFAQMGREHGLAVEDRRLYFHSTYFRFCLPLHAIWRLWIALFRRLGGSEAAETFACVFRKAEKG